MLTALAVGLDGSAASSCATDTLPVEHLPARPAPAFRIRFLFPRWGCSVDLAPAQTAFIPLWLFHWAPRSHVTVAGDRGSSLLTRNYILLLFGWLGCLGF